MSHGWPDGDTLVALLGLVMAALLVSRSAALQRLGARQTSVYAIAWAVVIGALAALAERFAS